MMTRQEYLLVCLAEECGEIIYEVGKILRFGLNDTHLDTSKIPNEERLSNEITDLIAVVKMLKDEGLNLTSSLSQIARKRDKIEKYAKYSQERGILLNFKPKK